MSECLALELFLGPVLEVALESSHVRVVMELSPAEADSMLSGCCATPTSNGVVIHGSVLVFYQPSLARTLRFEWRLTTVCYAQRARHDCGCMRWRLPWIPPIFSTRATPRRVLWITEMMFNAMFHAHFVERALMSWLGVFASRFVHITPCRTHMFSVFVVQRTCVHPTHMRLAQVL